MKTLLLKNLVVPIAFLFALSGNTFSQEKEIKPVVKHKYDVAAYVWPSCHHDERFGDMLWSDGTGEWEVIKKGTPCFEVQPAKNKRVLRPVPHRTQPDYHFFVERMD